MFPDKLYKIYVYICQNTVEYLYNMVKYDMIFHNAQEWQLQFMMK